MKTIVFSTIHFRDQAQADALAPELRDWHDRARAAFDAPPDIFLCESDTISGIALPVVCAHIPHTRPYHCKNWSYFTANLQYALFHVLHFYPDFDLCLALQSDAILGTRLQTIAEQFMGRPEVLAAPLWYGSPDTHCLMMKREAMTDILYSLPFTALPRVGGHNQLHIEHAIGALFRGRWWNPWPNVSTVRQEFGTSEIYKGPESDILNWPMLAKTSPALAEKYRKLHPIERKTP